MTTVRAEPLCRPADAVGGTCIAQADVATIDIGLPELNLVGDNLVGDETARRASTR
jgi:hypothetical protein